MENEKTNRELLSQVKDAISAILTTGQSYTIGSRTLTRANITELRKLAADLEAKVAVENTESPLLGNTYVGFFNGR